MWCWLWAGRCQETALGTVVCREGDVHGSEVSLGRAVTLCLPTFLHPKAAFSLFIPLQGNYLIIIKMSEGIHKYIHTLNEQLPQCTGRCDLWAPGPTP